MKKSIKRNIWLYIPLVVLIMLSTGSLGGLFFIASHEQFRILSSPTPQPTPVSETSWKQYTNDYFTLSYPGSAKEENIQKDSNPAAVASWVVYQSNPYFQFATQVLREPDMTAVTDFPAVAFRRIKSDTYTQMPVTAGGITGVQFSRHVDSENPAEFGAFFFEHHTIYTFVVQAKDELFAEQTYRRILSTLSFTK